MQVAFGPKDEVLAGMVKNHQEIQKTPVLAGGMS
jgi:ATP-binding cassette subfamily C protein